MDIRSCITSLAISASSGGRESLQVICRTVDQFTCSVSGEPRSKLEALLELRQAFVDLRLNGHAASSVLMLIDDKIGALMSRQIGRSGDSDDPLAA